MIVVIYMADTGDLHDESRMSTVDLKLDWSLPFSCQHDELGIQVGKDLQHYISHLDLGTHTCWWHMGQPHHNTSLE